MHLVALVNVCILKSMYSKPIDINHININLAHTYYVGTMLLEKLQIRIRDGNDRCLFERYVQSMYAIYNISKTLW